jgi:hypothetical protein
MSIWCRIGRECTGVINHLHDTSPNIQGYSRCPRFMRDLLDVRPRLLNLGCYTRGGSIIYAKSLSRELIDLCPILHNWKEHQCDSREFSDMCIVLHMNAVRTPRQAPLPPVSWYCKGLHAPTCRFGERPAQSDAKESFTKPTRKPCRTTSRSDERSRTRYFSKQRTFGICSDRISLHY